MNESIEWNLGNNNTQLFSVACDNESSQPGLFWEIEVGKKRVAIYWALKVLQVLYTFSHLVISKILWFSIITTFF